MDFALLDALRQIQEKWPKVSGKIIEKLLAVSFGPKRGGYAVESKSIEGVDIGLVGPNQKYAVEVKTTSGRYVTVQDKDINGLSEKAKKDGYIPCVAALRIDLLEDWVIARADRLLPGEYTPKRLALDSIPELEAIAILHFERTVLELAERVLSPPGGSPLNYLADILAKESLS